MKLTDDELLERARDRCRAYRQKNLEKLRAYDRLRRRNDKEKRYAYTRAWALRNPEKTRAAVRKSMAKNRSKYALYRSKWVSENRDKINAYSRAYYARNPEAKKLSVTISGRKKPWLAAERASRRRAMLKNATPQWSDKEAIRSIFKNCAQKTTSTGIPHEVDHIFPLVHHRFSGLHVPWNLQILTASENSRKGNRCP